jgi:urease accessory protein
MYAVISQSDCGAPANDLAGVRVAGGVEVRVGLRDGISRVLSVRERDGYKVRFPHRSAPPEAILINTGGGIASGDRIRQSFVVEAGAAMVATTQASERVYRTFECATTDVVMAAQVAEGGSFCWLPQDTILFDRSRLSRRLEVDLATDAQALIAETVVLGRAAMGETIAAGLFRDRWRIRRGGDLVFAENVLLNDGVFPILPAPATAMGCRVIMTAVLVAPGAPERLDRVRSVLSDAPFVAAASAWNGMMVVRGLADRSEDVRSLLARLIPHLGAPLIPRVWWT